MQVNNLIYEDKQVYMSPLLFREISAGNRKFKHRPFKSETFSLGMVLISLFVEESDFAMCYNRMAREFDYEHFGLLKDFIRETVFAGESKSLLADFIFVCLANPNESQRLDPSKALKTLERTVADLFVREQSKTSLEGKARELDKKSSEFLTETVKSSEIVDVTKAWGELDRTSTGKLGRGGSMEIDVDDFKSFDMGKRRSVLDLGEEEEDGDVDTGKAKEGVAQIKADDIQPGESSGNTIPKPFRTSLEKDIEPELLKEKVELFPEDYVPDAEMSERDSELGKEIFQSKVEMEDSQTVPVESKLSSSSRSQTPNDEDNKTLSQESDVKLGEDSDDSFEGAELEADSDFEEGMEGGSYDSENDLSELEKELDLNETLYASVSRLDEKVNNLNDIYHQNIQNLVSYLRKHQQEDPSSQIGDGSVLTEKTGKSSDPIHNVKIRGGFRSKSVKDEIVHRSLTKGTEFPGFRC